ncbi:ATP-binding protein [Pontibacter liquoris]|uniref:ATP-binding protein n=1 Tax=Pontibacter liquoris TaxID=2905677 RepID=UPI001FA6D9FF|nr:ATP-binding protein [Pontibacter liquoris]
MMDNIKPKEATAIVNSLLGGVVPKIGVQHITVGRSAEIEAFIKSLEDVKNGHSMVKFWIGDFGSGKSFMMHLLNTVALKQKFVVANADFTPDNRLYSNDGKAVALYSAIMDNIAIQTKPEGGALATLLEKWIEQVITKTSQDKNIPLTQIREEQHLPLIQRSIMNTINELTDVGGFDFGVVVMKYYEGYISDNEQLRRNALKWLKGEYRTKTEARQDLGVREIIHDLNYYDMLKNFCKLFVSMGYSGFMINLDEAINLYKISTSVMREKNYEKVLAIYNDCFQGKVSNFFINFAGTKEVLENERRGLFSYHALKSRLETNKFETLAERDFSQPVIRLMPLNHTEIFVLLKKLKAIFDFNYKTQLDITDEEIHQFMEEMFNKPGASEFLTPREVIRDFLNILSIIRQNPSIDKQHLFGDIEIHDERPDESAVDSLVDSIEVL